MVSYEQAVVDGLELFSKSKWHKYYNVLDVQRYLISPIKYNRIRMFYKDKKPVGLITWCWLNKQSAKDFLKQKYYITEEDYKDDTKEELWAIELLAPYGNAYSLVKQMRQEHRNTYKRNEKVNWRRLHDPERRHTRELRT